MILSPLDSPASHAGLKQFDAVIRINGQNIAEATADMVATIVR